MNPSPLFSRSVRVGKVSVFVSSVDRKFVVVDVGFFVLRPSPPSPNFSSSPFTKPSYTLSHNLLFITSFSFKFFSFSLSQFSNFLYSFLPTLTSAACFKKFFSNVCDSVVGGDAAVATFLF